MKSITYKNATYTVDHTSRRGWYNVTKETKSGKQAKDTNDASIYDWMDDDSEPKLHKDALYKLSCMFPTKYPSFTFRLPPELKRKAEEAAKMDRRTLPDWIRKVIEDAVEQSDKTRK